MTRANWQRVEASISLDLSMLTELIRPVFPGLAVIASEPAMGGLSNTNLRLTVEQRPTPVHGRTHAGKIMGVREPR